MTRSAVPPRGLVHGVRLAASPQFADYGLLAWDFHQPVDRGQHFWIYQNGDNIGFVGNGAQKRFAIQTVRDGVVSKFDVLPAHQTHNLDTNLFYSLLSGNRFRLSWSENTEADFATYKLYWDQGLGGAYSLLATIIGRTNNSYIVGPLAAGTYKYELHYTDTAGNEHDPNVDNTIVVRGQPLALEGVSITYDSTPPLVTITGTSPVAQIADYVGAVIYWNYIPALVRGNDVNKSRLRRISLELGDSINWTSRPLWPGRWVFAVAAITKYGIEAASDEQAFQLEYDTGVLVDVGDQSLTVPHKITATATAAGAISVTIYYTHTVGASVRLYVDDVDTDNEVSDASGEATINFAGADGQEYKIEATMYNADYETEKAGPIYITADATAPTGDGIITFEAIQ